MCNFLSKKVSAISSWAKWLNSNFGCAPSMFFLVGGGDWGPGDGGGAGGMPRALTCALGGGCPGALDKGLVGPCKRGPGYGSTCCHNSTIPVAIKQFWLCVKFTYFFCHFFERNSRCFFMCFYDTFSETVTDGIPSQSVSI